MRSLILSVLGYLLVVSVLAQETESLDNYIVDRFVDSTGREVVVIKVPGKPPDSFRMPAADPTEATSILANVPAFDWCFGCSATSAAMMAGYYDRTGYSNMYAGPTNGGVSPMDNSVWGTVTINGEVRSQCPFSATRNGLDGRTTRGHVDDFWIKYLNPGPDPYIVNGWTMHTYGDCTADFMKTSQSAYSSKDGSTWFYNYYSGAPYSGSGNNNDDGMYGLKLFFESRGYTVTSHYNQYIYGYNGNTLGFTFTQFKQEIDAGRPVLIQVVGHTMLGYGYNETGNIIYIHDTWDYSSHTMTWGGSYSGMTHYAVGVISLQCTTPAQPGTITGNSPVCQGSSNTYSITAVTGATSYTWSLPSGWTGSSTTTSITTTAGSTGGTISVKANNTCGSSTARTKSVTVNTVPAQPGTITGNSPVCQGSSNTYSITAVTGATSYTWSLPSGWTGSSTTTSITTTAGSTGGNISVTANNTCGASTARTKSVSVTLLPSQPGVISGDATVGQGSVNTYTISAVSGATSYTWTIPAGWSGSSTSTSITTLAGSSGGTISVKANNSCGSGPSRTKTLTVIPFQSMPGNQTIGNGQSQCYNALQNIVVAGFGNSFTVQNGGSAIMIAGTNINYLPGTKVYSGGYMHGYIAPTGPWCNQGSTLPLAENRLEAEDNQEDEPFALRQDAQRSFRIYPNPTSGTFTLELNGIDLLQNVEVQIYTMQGEKILLETYAGQATHEFSLFDQPAGIYVIRVVTEGMAETVKLVKI